MMSFLLLVTNLLTQNFYIFAVYLQLCLTKTKREYLPHFPRRQLHPSNSQLKHNQHRRRSSHCRHILTKLCHLSNCFPSNLEKIITYKPLELESSNFEKKFIPHHLSHVTCHPFIYVYIYIYLVFHLFQLKKSGGTNWCRVCYQRGLPCLV